MLHGETSELLYADQPSASGEAFFKIGDHHFSVRPGELPSRSLQRLKRAVKKGQVELFELQVGLLRASGHLLEWLMTTSPAGSLR